MGKRRCVNLRSQSLVIEPIVLVAGVMIEAHIGVLVFQARKVQTGLHVR